MAADRYDAVPYPSAPFPQTHPDRTGAIAVLFGMRPAPADGCRVLELGCGNGANLVPMAHGLPGSRFLGIDLAAAPVARAREAVAALGLDNIAVERGDIQELAQSPDRLGGPFDYVIVHGVYSWVPEDVRRAMLLLIRSVLAPQGVAYVSYNAYPGFHTRQMVREMLLFHAGGDADSLAHAAAARELAGFLAQALPATEELAPLRNELRASAERATGVLSHDELAPINQAFYFHEFAASAASQGLQYLGEADFPEMVLHRFTPEVRAVLEKIDADRGPLAKEQYVDFLKVRRFRQTLLCHASVNRDREATAERASRLLVGSPIRPVSPAPDLRPGVVEEFAGPAGSLAKTDLPMAKVAMLCLGERWPHRLSVGELAQEAMLRLPADSRPDAVDEVTATLSKILLEMAGAGLVQLYTYRPALATTPGDRPQTTALARWQAAQPDQVGITTLLHTSVQVDEVGRRTLRLLDGTRDRTELLEQIRPWFQAGQPDASQLPGGELTPLVLEQSLQRLGTLGLLIG